MIKLPPCLDLDLSDIKAVRREGMHIIIEVNNIKLKIYDADQNIDNMELLKSYFVDGKGDPNAVK